MMNEWALWADGFWTGMLRHLLQAGVVLVILAVLARVLRHGPARWTSALLWLAVIKLFLPLEVLGAWTGSLFGAIGAEPVPRVSGATALGSWIEIVAPFDAAPDTNGSGWGLVWMLMWAVGIAIVLGRIVSNRSVGPGRDDVPGLPDELAGKLLDACRGASVSRKTVRVTSLAIMPSATGIFRPRILVPYRLVEQLPEQELRAVLLHEQAHLRRRDPLRYGLLTLGSALFFFYPPMWWLSQRVRRADELACDEAVVEAGIDPEDYARAIAHTIRLGLSAAPAPAAIDVRRKSFLTERFERMRSARRFAAMPRHRLTLAAGFVLFLAACLLPIASSEADRSADEAKKQPFAELKGLEGADVVISLELEEASVEQTLDLLARSAGFEVEGTIPDARVTLDVDRSTVEQALIKLAQQHGLRYEVPTPVKLRVLPGTLIAGMGGVTNPAKKGDAVQPVYPPEMREQHIEGMVILQVIVDRNGAISETTVLNARPKDRQEFIDSAIEAVEQWRYEPATLDGEPVDVYFTVRIEFKLHESGSEKKDGKSQVL